MKKKQTIEELKQEGLVTTADKVSLPSVFAMMIPATSAKSWAWVDEIEAYCGEMGILPSDLIETHRQSLKMARKGLKSSKNDEIAESKPHSNWFENYRKAKTGYPAPK